MNPVVHFEMPYDDRDRIMRFYRAVFDWKLTPFGGEGGDYVLATTVEEDTRPDAPRGAINGGLFPRDVSKPGQYPSVVIAVRDLVSAMKAVNEAGGEVLGAPMDIPGVGRYVAFHDTERNRLSMLQPEMPAGH